MSLSEIHRELCIRRFDRFVREAWEHVGFPDRYFVGGRHIDIICDRLQAAAEGRTRSLLLNVPPRHTKSSILLVWQAWVWAAHEHLKDRLISGPSVQFLRISYDQGLVRRDSARCRRLVRSPWYRDLTEGRVEIREDRATIDAWELTAGGGLNSAPMRGGITGVDANCQILDDPHSVLNVESRADRDVVKMVFREVLPSRVNDPKKLVKIVAAQRTHVDDLSAEIIAGSSAGEWEHVCLPAHYNPDHPHAYAGDDREPGEILWPERFDEEGLRTMSRDMTLHARAAQLEQYPQARGAGLFRNAQWRFEADWPRDMRLVRYWDKAATEEGQGADPDFTAGGLGGRDQHGRFWLVDMQRGRWSSHQVEERIKFVASELDPQGTQIYIEEEPGSAGKDVTSYYQRHVLRGFPVRGDRPTGPKLVRVDPMVAAAEAGNVIIVRGDWNRAFIDECDAFTGGDSGHDDQVVAAMGAFKYAMAGVFGPLVW